MKSTLLSNFIGLGVLLGLSFAVVSITNNYILTINFYNNNGELFSGFPEQNSYVYESLQKWIYLTTAAYLLLKIAVISLILYTALYVSNNLVSYGKVFQITLFAESIFILQAFSKVIWFKYEYPNGSIVDWHKTYLLSLLSIVREVPADWYYPLQSLNLFELAYWFLLAYGLNRISKLDYDGSLRIVIMSYVPALFIWIACVVFCTLLTFPQNA